jgi:hypothetical protein
VGSHRVSGRGSLRRRGTCCAPTGTSHGGPCSRRSAASRPATSRGLPTAKLRRPRWIARALGCSGRTAGLVPDGKTIAYFASGCAPTPDNKGRIRLVTPTGRDATPPTAPCDGIGPAGHPVPAWSPDGQQIAVGTDTAQYVMKANGASLRQVQRGRFTPLARGLHQTGLAAQMTELRRAVRRGGAACGNGGRMTPDDRLPPRIQGDDGFCWHGT